MKNLMKQFYSLYALCVSSEDVQYQLLGDDFRPGSGDESACSLSSDGETIVIGTEEYDGANGAASGRVQVYALDGSQWFQRGMDIYGESAGDRFGSAVSISENGMIVAIGAPLNDEKGSSSGHVRVYSYNGSTWNQMGNDLDGENAEDEYGSAVSISSNGMIVAIGGTLNDENGADSGHVRIYSFDGITWNQVGTDIDGENAWDKSGVYVSITLQKSITTVAIGQEDGGIRIFTTSCDIGTFFTSDGTSCTTSCEAGELIALDGKSCTTSCETGEITNLDGTSCTTCDIGELVTLDGTSCTTSCETGELITLDRTSCTASCLSDELINSLQDSCISNCSANQLISSNNDSCVVICPADEFIASDKQSCIVKCPENEFYFKSNCYLACPKGTAAEPGDVVCALLPSSVSDLDFLIKIWQNMIFYGAVVLFVLFCAWWIAEYQIRKSRVEPILD